MRKQLLLLCLGLNLTAPSWAAELPPEILASAAQRVEYGLNPALAIVYLEKGKPPVIQTWGRRNLSPQAEAVTPKTSFELGSLSKLFTALEAAYLVEQKKLSPEQSLKTFWPKDWGVLPLPLEKISLQSLLAHRSGLPRLPANFAPANPEDPYLDYSQEKLMAFLAQFTPEKTPAAYTYSNLAYGLLGALEVPLSGSANFQAMLARDLFGPLGMSATGTSALKPPQFLAQPHFDGIAVPAWTFSEVTAGAGALRSNAEDMARFLQAQFTPPSNPLGQAIQRSQMRLPGEDKPHLAYAWHIIDYKGRTLHFHNGQTGGSLSFIGLDLKNGKGAVVLSNNTDAIEDLGLHLLTPDSPLRKITDLRKPPATLAAYVGQYQLAPGMVFTITQAAGYLQAQLTGQPALRIFPTDQPMQFKYQAVEATLTFQSDESGKVKGLNLEQNGQSHWAGRM
ncbi:MAG: serine hydrolase [Candidatus Sericytochromatia bacterium]